MKNTMLLLLALLLLSSCDQISDLLGLNDDDNNEFRVSKLYEYEIDGTTLISEIKFTYEGENLIQWEKYSINDDGALEQTATADFEYDDNGVVVISETYRGQKWAPQKFYIEDEKVSKIEIEDFRNGKTIVEDRFEYFYNDGKLINYIGSWDNADGSKNEYEKVDYLYSGDILANVLAYTSGVPDWDIWYQDSVFSSEGKIDSIFQYATNNGIQRKSFYTYSGGLLDEVRTLSLNNITKLLEEVELAEYTFDSDKNLWKLRLTRLNMDDVAYELIWENQKGNEELLWKKPNDINPGRPVLP